MTFSGDKGDEDDGFERRRKRNTEYSRVVLLYILVPGMVCLSRSIHAIYFFVVHMAVSRAKHLQSVELYTEPKINVYCCVLAPRTRKWC